MAGVALKVWWIRNEVVMHHVERNGRRVVLDLF